MPTAAPYPDRSLLAAYRDAKAHTDGFYLDVPGAVTLGDYLEAFYTTPLFKLECLILAALVAKPSSDAQARALARSDRQTFAAWTVETRHDDQIVLRDFLGKTSSWLMVEPMGQGTRLWFGTAIVPERVHADGRVWLGLGFHALMPFHRLYSHALLSAAARNLAS